MRRTIAVVLAAGQGTRMGASQNKVFLPLAGRPLLTYSLEAFGRAHEVDDVLLVAHPRELDYCRREIVERYDVKGVTAIVAGGATRHQSEQNALETLRTRIVAGVIDVALVHDGARPLVEPDDIDAVVRAARLYGGALLGTRIGANELLGRVDGDGMLLAQQPTDDLWRAQTPQAFNARALLESYDGARIDGFEGTDTAASYERLGKAVRMVEGRLTNFKVTTREDLVRAEAILQLRTTG